MRASRQEIAENQSREAACATVSCCHLRHGEDPFVIAKASEYLSAFQKKREEELRLGIAPEEGKEAFARILGSSLPQAIVSPRELMITGYKEQEADSAEPAAKVRKIH